ncbi:MAG: DUF2461 domain-containing protein [Acidobacteriota bacterium]|nr:DUF2461 domain-containing protein [Acidobacteriota bacterium]
MKTAFRGFTPEGIAFLKDLAANNDREWFTPRKPVFDATVRLPMIELVGALHREMLRFAPAYVGEPAKCVFRIYRDTRFSKNKTPYKTHIAASFWRNDLEKNGGAGYYFSVSPEEIEIAGGLYSPEPDTLLAVRQHIAENFTEFKRLCEARGFKALLGALQGASATRPPRGFDPAHPEIDLLKRKQYFVFITLDPALATGPRLFREIVKRFEAITGFNEFLNRPLRTR